MFRKRRMRGRILWLVVGILVVAIGLIWLMPWLTFSSVEVEAPKVDASKDQPEQEGATKDQPEDEIASEEATPSKEEGMSNDLPPPPSPPPPPPPPVQASASPPAQAPSLPSTPTSPPKVEEVPKSFLPPDVYWDYGANYRYYEPDYYWYYEADYWYYSPDY